jgi:outer membrane lipoprotein-sorting protein
MRTLHRVACVSVLAAVLPLAGCSYFIPTKRHLPVPIAPPNVQTLSPEDLVKQLNARWEAIQTLTVTAEITAHDKKEDYPGFRCNIVMQKPRMLRVLGRYFGVEAFDMASDGSRFTLSIPQKNVVIKGSNTATDKSATEWENLRPDFFFDAIIVRGLDPDDKYMVTSDTETTPDAANKHLYIEPEYTLSLIRQKGSSEFQGVRTVTFHRDDMMPYDQYVYDKDGALETQVFYSNYQKFSDFSGGKYPSKIVIKRPREGIEFDLAVEQVHNPTDLPAGEFDVKTPDGATIKELK